MVPTSPTFIGPLPVVEIKDPNQPAAGGTFINIVGEGALGGMCLAGVGGGLAG